MLRKNIYHVHSNSQLTGRKVHYHEVPKELVNHDPEQFDVWNSLRALDENNFAPVFKPNSTIQALERLHSLLEKTDMVIRIFADLKGGKQQSCSDTIHVFGGLEVLLRTLFHPSVQGNKAARTFLSSEVQQKIQQLCIELFQGMSSVSASISFTLGRHENLLKYLFIMMEDKKTIFCASSLLEELLATSRNIIDLKEISNISLLVATVRDNNFLGFCRILSTTIADIDISEERSTLIAQAKEEKDRSKERSLVEQNQGFLLNLPEFLSRMVKLASRPIPGGSINTRLPAIQNLVYHSPGGFDNLQELFHGDNSPNHLDISSPGTQPIPNNGISTYVPSSTTQGSSISRSINANSNSSSSFNVVANRPGTTNQVPQHEHGMIPNITVHHILNEVLHKCEIFYMLTLFLCGKYKYDVQTKLGDLKFIPTLCDMFDKLGWDMEDEQLQRHGIHENDDCDCLPEIAMKIQFLRFVHSFSDHNDKRYLLLSAREIQEVKDLCNKYGLPKPVALEKAKNKYRCHGQKGLITRIIEVLKKTGVNNSLRFWLSRAIEGFLRGAVSHPDQHFLMRRGLIKHLVEHITNEETKGKEIIQSSFDLLGELMKFNMTGFQHFNDAIENEEQFQRFLSVMTSNVVDSNMFIRCIMLTDDRFSTTGSYDVSKCNLGSYIRHWEHKMYLMYKLINSIAVESLTQENVSCLNTTLIFLMFAYKKGHLDKYLQAFLAEEEAQKHHGLILSNLRELLVFWRTHYLSRAKDCSQLEQSSSITFEKWQHVVEVLLSEDWSNRTSIMHYLTPVHRNTIRLRSVDYLLRDV